MFGKGDVIENGQILINGWMEGQYTGIRYMHASGEIEAKVWYIRELEENFIQQEKQLTNKTENKYSIIVNKKSINLYKSISKLKKYDTMETNNKFKIMNNFYIPIEIKKVTNVEYKLVEKEYTEEELKEKMILELEKQLEKDIKDKEIENRNVFIEPTEKGLKIKIVYEVIEKIGVEQRLVS